MASVGTLANTAAFAASLSTRIAYKVEAGKQFLAVVIGLGLTSAIAEKLKYGLNDSMAIQWVDPEKLLQPQRYSISSSHSDSIWDPEFSSLDTICLVVFLFYAIRFFFNNYVYLCQAYEGSKLSALDVRGIEHVSFDASLDLLLNLFTGIIICIVSMTLNYERVVYLLILLIAHYVVDMAILGIIWFRRRKELQAKGIFMRVLFWIGNNVLFTLVFSLILGLILGDGSPASQLQSKLHSSFAWTIGLWFLNCCLGVGITALWPDDQGELI